MSGIGRVLIAGAGQLGRELQRSFAGDGELICCDRDEVDIADPDQVRNLVQTVAPDLILNAAAYTAVYRAESEREVATAINAVAPRILAEEVRRRDILLVHYSTDYVFDGSKESSWLEIDQPNPLNHYGQANSPANKPSPRPEAST
jgi:dTDP-4-dehydrorhamnose reductase